VRNTLVFLFCAAYFLWFSASGLTGPLMPDDLMNIYGAWAQPWEHERLAAQMLLRGLYLAFGLNALAYRAVCYGLLLFNLAIAWRLYLRLGAFAAAAPALLLFTYQAYMGDLYLSGGTIYDLLCFALTYSCLLLHIRWRQDGTTPGWRRLAAWALLYLVALNSKEMAVALPVFIAAYEVVYHRSQWQWRNIALSGALAAGFLAVRFLRPGPIASNPAYHIDLRWSVFLDNWALYLNDLLYLGSWATPARALILWIVVIAAAALSRRRAALFGVLVFFAGSLPVIFIPHRGLFVMYLPYLGICLWAGAVLESALRMVPHRGLVLMLALAAALAPAHRWAQPYALYWYRDQSWMAPLMIEGLQREFPSAKRGARLLLLEDPYGRDEWLPLFAARLVYRDDTVFLERQKRVETPLTPAEIATYDAVFRMTREKGLTRVASATPPAPSSAGPAL
jgi:hypothetical protein